VLHEATEGRFATFAPPLIDVVRNIVGQQVQERCHVGGVEGGIVALNEGDGLLTHRRYPTEITGGAMIPQALRHADTRRACSFFRGPLDIFAHQGPGYHGAPCYFRRVSPMREQTVALIQRYYAAFNTADMAAFLDLLTDDVAHDINQGRRESGKAAFGRFMQHMNRCYREQLVDLVVMASDNGQRAAAEFTVLGEYLVSDEGLPAAAGQAYRLPAGAFFEVRDGRVARVTNYYNLQHWIVQVGG
jgi:steroid delta-isomerase-like uncharacterized protein